MQTGEKSEKNRIQQNSKAADLEYNFFCLLNQTNKQTNKKAKKKTF